MISLTRSQWLTLISGPAKAAPRKSPLPIEQCIRIRANGGTLSAEAGDRRVSVRTSMRVEAALEIDVVVDAHDVFDRVKVMPEGNVSIAVEGSALVIRGGSRRFAVPTVSVEDWPARAEVKGKPIAVNGAALAHVAKRVQHAMSTDETRPHVSSIRLVAGAEAVHCVATDGHRLAVAWSGEVDKGKLDDSTLVPRAAVPVLLGMATDMGELEITKSKKGDHLLVAGSVADVEHTATIAIQDAQFPPWERVIPAPAAESSRVDCVAMVEAVRAVAVAASDRSGGVTLRWGDGAIVITAQSADRGDASDQVHCDGEPAIKEPVGSNNAYLVDALQACGTDANVECSGPLDPIVLRADGTIQVIMPMRV